MRNICERYKCKFCKRNLPYKNLIRHLRRRHGGEGEEMINSSKVESTMNQGSSMEYLDAIDCPECKKSLSAIYIDDHLAFVHRYTARERKITLKRFRTHKAMTTLALLFKCDTCSDSFHTKRELTTHRINAHPMFGLALEEDRLTCSFDSCQQSFTTHEDLVYHCALKHSDESHTHYQIINQTFNDMEDVLKWKTSIGQTFAVLQKQKASNHRLTEFLCPRTVSFVQTNNRDVVIKSRVQCTAFLKCWTRRDRTVEIIACTEHIGHEEPYRPLITEKQEDERRKNSSETNTFYNGSPSSDCPNTSESFEKVRTKFLVDAESHEHEQLSTSTDVARGRSDENASRGTVQEKIRKSDDIYHCCKQCAFFCFTKNVLDAHSQCYHPESHTESHCKQHFSHIMHCPKCKMSFKTNYLFAVHCVNLHSEEVCGLLPIQTSFTNWTKFEPWLEQMETATNTTLTKTSPLTSGTKLLHNYCCSTHQTIGANVDIKTNMSQNIYCPAFVTVIENEDGVLDCVGFFGHLRNNSSCAINDFNEGQEMESTRNRATNSMTTCDSSKLCCLCGNVEPPEIDGMAILQKKWSYCDTKECNAIAHSKCIQLLGGKCLQCYGVLIYNST